MRNEWPRKGPKKGVLGKQGGGERERWLTAFVRYGHCIGSGLHFLVAKGKLEISVDGKDLRKEKVMMIESKISNIELN